MRWPLKILLTLKLYIFIVEWLHDIFHYRTDMYESARSWCTAQGCRESLCEKYRVESTILTTYMLGPCEIWTHQTYSKIISLSQISDLKLRASLAAISHSLTNIPIFEIDPCLNFYFANWLRSSVSIGWRAYLA